jgi:hypothetical protein
VSLEEIKDWIGPGHYKVAFSWYHQLRILLSEALHREWVKLRGTVEVDETMLGHVSGEVGHRSVPLWVIGVCGKEPASPMICKCLYNEGRTTEVCCGFISEFCEDGSMIYSDGWRPYQDLPHRGFRHQWVNHSKEFVRPDGMNTQRIESLWGVMKRWIDFHRYLKAEWRQLYVDDFVYRHNHGMKNWPAVWRALFNRPLASRMQWNEPEDKDEGEQEVDELTIAEEWEGRLIVDYGGYPTYQIDPGLAKAIEWQGHEEDCLLILKVWKKDWAEPGEVTVYAIGHEQREFLVSRIESDCDGSDKPFAASKGMAASLYLGEGARGSVVVSGVWYAT